MRTKYYCRFMAALLTIAILGVTVAGCERSEKAGMKKGASKTKTTGETIGIGTASIGGALYAIGGGFTKVWDDIGVSASVEVTGGSVHNATLIHAGELESAIISQGVAYEAFNATGLFEGNEQHTNIRAALPLNSAYIYAWTLEENAKGYDDFQNRVVSGGPVGGTSDEYTKHILDIIGVKPKRFIAASFADTTGMLRDGLVDIVASSASVPGSAAAEAVATLGANIIGLGHGEYADKVIREMPFFYKTEIVADTYQGQSEPIATIADLNVYCFHKDVPEDIVYKFLKASFEQHDYLVSTSAGLKEMAPENVSKLVLPLHPGAYKYFKELGMEIPEAAKPID